jgi:hypothetical protein
VTPEDLRPILSGLAGAAIAGWISNRLARWIPGALNGKSADALLREHRWPILAANIAFALGLFGGLALYQWGHFARNDLRPVGLGFGFALSAPLLVLPLAAWLANLDVRESLVSYAISQRMPVALIYTVLLLGVPLFAVSLNALF